MDLHLMIQCCVMNGYCPYNSPYNSPTEIYLICIIVILIIYMISDINYRR